MYIVEQQQKLRIISECCICRRDINSNEKTIVCPNCHTIYHHKHLSLWLKIRRKCPICKNLIKDWLVHSYTNVKDNSSLNCSTLNQISWYRNPKKKDNFQQNHPEKDLYLFECHHCGNILNIQVGNSSIQCNVCGSSISINLHVTSKNHIKRRNKIERNRGKVSSRRLKLQKKVTRDIYRKELQEQSQIELQQQIALLLNQEYLKRQSQERDRHQNSSLKYIGIKNEEIEHASKKANLFNLIPRALKQLGRFRIKAKNIFNKK